MSSPAYSDDETETLITLLTAGFDTAVVAKIMKRSVDSVRVKASKLRAEAKLDRLPGRPAPQSAGASAASDPGISLSNDQALVRACRVEGGFPQAITLHSRTFWIRSDGSQWSHTPAPGERKAA